MSLVVDRLADCRQILRPRRPRTLADRLLIVAGSIVLALVVDAITGGRWRWLVASAATLTSLLALVPALSWLVKPIGAYVGVWLGFNLLRARADGTGWADRVLGLVPELEAAVFAGHLPSAVLQERFAESSPVVWYDYGLTAVYLSFFVAPHLVAVLLLWRDRRLFWHYLLAIVALFAVSLVGFFAIPTAPPWLVTEAVPESDFAQVRRVTEEVLRSFDLPVRLYNRGQGETAHVSEVRIEPNPVAAMPSMHFATTALLVFPARHAARLPAGGAIVYAASMGIARVYRVDHYVLDLVVGGALAVSGWGIAGGCLDAGRKARRAVVRRRGPRESDPARSSPRPRGHGYPPARSPAPRPTRRHESPVRPIHHRSPIVTPWFTAAHRHVHGRPVRLYQAPRQSVGTARRRSEREPGSQEEAEPSTGG